MAYAAQAKAVNHELIRVGEKPIPDAVLSEAFARLEPISDPMDRQIAEMAGRAQVLG